MAIMECTRPIVLATASEARRKLVADAGIAFATRVVDIDETPRDDEDVSEYVSRLARAKAEAVVPPSLDAVIVAVDTAIGLDRRIIGKPRDEHHARDILRALSGREHEVASAIAVRDLETAEIAVERISTDVLFWKLSDAAIEWYIGTGEWKGKAGGYAIQGKGAALVESVSGCFTNVIGLSMPTFLRMLARMES
jgi:septum formation protein